MHPRHARPPRSALYMPGANARALDKARGLDADVLILDLGTRSRPTPSHRRAQRRVARLAGRRLRPTRMRGAHQRAGHAGTGRRARPRRRRRRRRAAAGRKPGPAGRWRGHWTRPARRRPSLVGHVRNAVGLSASGRHRRPSPAGGPGRGHVGPGQGSACAPHAGPRGNAAGAFAGHHGRPRPRTGGVGWRAPDLDDDAGLALACESKAATRASTARR